MGNEPRRGDDCTKCSGTRRFKFHLLFPADIKPGAATLPAIVAGTSSRPAKASVHGHLLVLAHCTQCDALRTLLRCPGPDGKKMLINAPNTPGGLSTTHTPKEVAFYLDQASRCEAVGAHSAAAAMYRAALEQMLFGQGYMGMLGKQLQTLEQNITTQSGPAWSNGLEIEFLDSLKELGNGAIHANGGDITKQDAIDAELLKSVKVTFEALLHLAYEIPQQQAKNLASLKAAKQILKK